jgi:two-component system sensor histidine kinase VicK
METESIEMFELMMGKADEVFFLFDTDHLVFRYVNEAFQAISKRERQELYDDPTSLFDIIHKEDLGYVKESFNMLITKTTPSLLDFRICRSDQTERWIRMKIYPILTAGAVKYLAGIAEDDSARKVSIFNMQKVNGWKNANFEIISHDLRGPIGIVQMLSSVIGKKLPEDKDIQRLTQLIQEISQRNINLIENVLSSEAVDTAGVEINKERHNVVWDVYQAMDFFIKSQEDLKKKIVYTHSHDQIYAAIDSMKFLQIVNNLVSNAIKFTPDNGSIKVHLEKLEDRFLLTVKDNGIGIPKKMHPSLFRKYTPAERNGTEGEKSVGLGMWIVKTLTDAHNGKVWFESEPNTGSKFYVEIPLS